MSKILAIDGDFLLYYSTAPLKLKSIIGVDEEGNNIYEFVKDENNKQVYIDKTLDECLSSVDDILRNIFVKTNIFNYIAFLGGVSNFRKIITPDYKANRIKLVKPTFIKEVENYLVDKYEFTITDNIEADDAVNICKKQIDNIVIVSPDKDILNCIEGTHFNPRKMEWVTTSDEDANYNFYTSLITGDTIDNIKGLSGKGVVYASKVLSDCKEDNDHYKYITRILSCYIQQLGQYDGINQFYINYNLLKLLDYKEGFVIPKILKYELSNLLDDEEIGEIE